MAPVNATHFSRQLAIRELTTPESNSRTKYSIERLAAKHRVGNATSRCLADRLLCGRRKKRQLAITPLHAGLPGRLFGDPALFILEAIDQRFPIASAYQNDRKRA